MNKHILFCIFMFTIFSNTITSQLASTPHVHFANTVTQRLYDPEEYQPLSTSYIDDPLLYSAITAITTLLQPCKSPAKEHSLLSLRDYQNLHHVKVGDFIKTFKWPDLKCPGTRSHIYLQGKNIQKDEIRSNDTYDTYKIVDSGFLEVVNLFQSYDPNLFIYVGKRRAVEVLSTQSDQ